MNSNRDKTIHRETGQSQKILELLCSTKSHPTADWIYERAKKEFPKLSLGTVYRNLKVLTGQGMALELPFGDTFDRFDGNPTSHPHFICKACGAVYDVEMKQPKNIIDVAKKTSGFKIDECQITFKGKCSKCKNKGGG